MIRTTKLTIQSFFRRGCMLALWIALLCASCWAAGVSASDDKATAKPTGEEKQIRSLIADYAKSVDAADTALASRVWSHSPEASSIYPLGEEHGFENIKQHLYIHLMGEMFSERDLQIHDISVHVYGATAWSEFSWDFQAKLKKDGSPMTTHGRETQIYHKEKDGWRLVHVHYSGIPAAARLGL